MVHLDNIFWWSYMLYEKSGVTRILQCSQRNGKLPLPWWKKGLLPDDSHIWSQVSIYQVFNTKMFISPITTPKIIIYQKTEHCIRFILERFFHRDNISLGSVQKWVKCDYIFSTLPITSGCLHITQYFGRLLSPSTIYVLGLHWSKLRRKI